MARHTFAMLLILALVLSACSSGDDDPTATTAAETEPTATEVVSAATTPDHSTATDPPATSTPSATATREPTATTEPTLTPTPLPPTATPEPTATSSPTPVPPTPTPELFPGTQPATVVGVVDGDTLDVEYGGQVHRVRLIGVDTPETVAPNTPVQCFGPEATAFTTQQAGFGTTVYLEMDVSETDQYYRLLRYAWLPDGRMLNEELVYHGYAQVVTYPPDVKYVDRFLAAQDNAAANSRGYWGACVATATPVPPPPAPEPPAPPAQGNCDPSYPDVCIPPYSEVGDLDCGDISFRRFSVVPPDPHGFDGDDDGVGCES